MLWPVMIVVCANTCYHICSKSTPEDANSFASLTVTYTVAAAVSFILLLFSCGFKNPIREFGKLNLTSVILGIAIVGLEFGYICVYRAGWKISTASLVANIIVACILLLVGILIFKETLSARQAVGMCLCAAGLILISR